MFAYSSAGTWWRRWRGIGLTHEVLSPGLVILLLRATSQTSGTWGVPSAESWWRRFKSKAYFQAGRTGWLRGMEHAGMKRCQQEELRRCSEFSTKWMNSALCTDLAPWQRVPGLEWGLEDTAVMMWMSPPTLILRFNWHADDIRKWLAMIGSRLMPSLKYCVSLTNFNMLAFHPLPWDNSVWTPLLNVIAMPLDFLPEIHYHYTT